MMSVCTSRSIGYRSAQKVPDQFLTIWTTPPSFNLTLSIPVPKLRKDRELSKGKKWVPNYPPASMLTTLQKHSLAETFLHPYEIPAPPVIHPNGRACLHITNDKEELTART
ncbi:hypothetical protein L873DRAFT_1805317 [Choiromyces venosus 120613-1]|uniref:Uncharacterized protein n=1 Tax=Choiromyces venosus 120613-1 TaxID=1336337 RepID=A0A3N4JQA4_9PEZI|nr:hypothetical protein L873DRAFT_1805317 [Choiromyces venosus 120613-1]